MNTAKISKMIVTYHDPGDTVSEAFRVLRTNLQFMGLDKPLKSLLVTSATPGEGKTTTAANLAVAFAQTGAQVCLVDGDLRLPSVAKVFGVEGFFGLTTVLIGQGDLNSTLKPTAVDGLWILPAGPTPPNPAEILGTQEMAALLGRLEERFDMVVVDSPPVLAVTDAAVLAPKVSGILLVIRQGKVAREQVNHAVEALNAVKANVLGVALDGVRPDRRGAYGYK